MPRRNVGALGSEGGDTPVLEGGGDVVVLIALR